MTLFSSEKHAATIIAPSSPSIQQQQQQQYWSWTLALCLCTLTHAYLLINVFPYAGYMAIDLLPLRANEETAGTYAGLLASAFMLGRAISSYAWGKWADVYGRTTVLHASLLLSSACSILFGMAQTFVGALLYRGFLGWSNGIVGTTKTLVTELAHGDTVLETRAMAMVIGMRGWGFLLSPAIGGSLAQVTNQYPNASWVIRMEPLLSKYPFLLPNLVGAVLCLVSMIAVKLYIQETLPEEQLQSPTGIVRDCWTCCVRQSSKKEEEAQLLMDTSQTSYTSSYLEDEEEDIPTPVSGNLSARLGRPSLTVSLNPQVTGRETHQSTTMALIWSRPDTRRHLLIYWIYSFVIIAVDEAFPLFCISKQAGLGLSEGAIGKILSISGFLFVLCQYCCYTSLVNSFGIYASIHVATFTTVPAICLIPCSLLFQSHVGDLNTLLLVYLSILMAIYRIFANMFFASITIATNRTVTARDRASMNGLSMLGASISKSIGPAMAGVFVAFMVSSGVVTPHVGAVLVFAVLGLLALLVAIPAATRLEPTRRMVGTGDLLLK